MELINDNYELEFIITQKAEEMADKYNLNYKEAELVLLNCLYESLLNKGSDINEVYEEEIQEHIKNNKLEVLK